MPPLRQYFSRLRKKRQTSPLLPPKGADSGPHGPFPCKSAGFGGPREGTMIAILDPLASPTAVGWARAMPPVAAVLVPAVKMPDEFIADPKGRGPPDPAAFPLQTGRFRGTAGRGPCSPSWTPLE